MMNSRTQSHLRKGSLVLALSTVALLFTLTVPAFAKSSEVQLPSAPTTDAVHDHAHHKDSDMAMAHMDAANNALTKVDFKQNLGQQVPGDVTFLDQLGKPVTLSQIADGKPVFLMMGYFHCKVLCDQVIEYLAGSVSHVPYKAGKDYQIVFISIDSRETPADARTKLQNMVGAGHTQGWHMLTGKQDAIKKVAAAIGFEYAYDAKSDQYAHPAGAVMLTSNLVISRYLYGLRFAPRDMKFALIDASQGKVGSIVDRVLLCCYSYDPTTGKYGMTIAAALDVGCGATVLGLVILVGALSYKNRRQKLPRGFASKADSSSSHLPHSSSLAKDKA